MVPVCCWVDCVWGSGGGTYMVPHKHHKHTTQRGKKVREPTGAHPSPAHTCEALGRLVMPTEWIPVNMRPAAENPAGKCSPVFFVGSPICVRCQMLY